MAGAQNIQRAHVYVSSIKLAELSDATFSGSTGGEQHHGDEGVVGISEGNPTGDVRCNHIIPTPGTAASNKLLELHFSQAYCALSLQMGGKAITGKFKLVECEITSTSATGALTGSFTFRSGDTPKLI
ncbi:MAG: hypothetical protein HOW73_20580 [Polyangiaceae bacterium]|nr:hypothetical protein [Polyangiaceae bacterium]